MSKSLKATRAKGVLVLAWASFGLAFLGGTAASGTALGKALRTVLGWVPWEWLPVVIVVILLVGTLVDLFMDGVPNAVALYSAIALPSLATAAPGKLGATLTGWANGAMDHVDDWLKEWLGTDSSIAIALACVAVALILARRVVKTGRKGKAAGAVA